MSASRRWLVLGLALAMGVPGGVLDPIVAAAVGAKKSSSSSVTTSARPTATAAAPPTVATPGANGLSGFPAPPVATSSTTPPVVNAPAGSTGSGSFSSASALIIVIGAGAVLLGISFFIWRDARRRAPVHDGGRIGPEGRSKPGSKPPSKPRKLSPAERRRRKRGRAKR